MKCLITGITGQVSSYLAEYLLANNYEVFGIKRWRSPMTNINHIKDKIKLYDADFRDTKAMFDVINEVKPDKIFHVGAQSYVPYSFTNPIDTINTNILGTLNILEAVRNAKIDPIILIVSSSEVYGTAENFPTKETEPFRPASVYAFSKCSQDLLGQMYNRIYGMKIVISRAFTHTSPRRDAVFVESAFAKQIAMIEKGLQEPILKVGNLNSIRRFMDARDIVEAYWILTEKGTGGESYNIAGGTEMTIKELLDKFLEMSPIGKDIKIVQDEKLLRPKDVNRQDPDTSKFDEISGGWKPKIPFTKTMQDLLNHWRRNV